MDKTRGYQASIDYLMPIVTNPVMTGEYCRHLRNSIDAMMKFERIQRELERLNAENAKLRAVVDAAREDLAIVCTSGETCAVCQNVENRGDNFPCRVSDGWCCGDKWVWRGEQALAELDKEERHEAGGE